MPVPDPAPPIQLLGRYEILGKIATGGTATVYLARLGGLGGFAREFALKVIHPHLAEVSGFRDRFEAEARLASRLRHENAVATIDVGEDEGLSYLVLELIEGVTLRQLMLHRERGLGPIVAATIGVQVARGLAALHEATDEKGEPLCVVHRDLSPQNIMVDEGGRAVLIDLGLARAAEHTDITQGNVLAGKLPYMSPEQTRLQQLDARSDVFSLGTVLFELCTGELPFGDTHTNKTLESLQESSPGPIDKALLRRDVPRWLIEIVLACVRPRPRDRFQSAAAVAEALETELHRAGADRSAHRRALGTMVEAVMPEFGPRRLAPPTLPPRIAPAVQATSALRWVGLGIALVLSGVLAHRMLDAEPSAEATAVPRGAPAPLLAPDTARPRHEAAEAVPKVAPKAQPILEVPAEAEPTPQGRTRPRKPRPKPRNSAPALKPNPYRG